MSYSCTILADSIAPHRIRLTTFEVTFPRFLLAEFNTHRMLSRNSASSRAIPTERLIEEVRNRPFIPDFNKRVTGMGVGEALSPRDNRRMQAKWLNAAHAAADTAEVFLEVDKSRANRLLEPFLWQTVIVTATDWDNFFKLRCHPDTQPEFQKIAWMMLMTMHHHEPQTHDYSGFHLPLITEEEKHPRHQYSAFTLMKASAGRGARVSYLTHEKDEDIAASKRRWEQLAKSGHWSPGEHAAVAGEPIYQGNLKGWRSLRKHYENEAIFTEEAEKAPAA
jgi:thymidylate synthase ThyX